MTKDSEEAAELREDFSHYSSRFQIVSFCEDIIMSRPIGKLIVGRESAFLYLPNERRITLHATHADICKFPNGEDPNLRVVGEEMARLVDNATRQESGPDAAQEPSSRAVE